MDASFEDVRVSQLMEHHTINLIYEGKSIYVLFEPILVKCIESLFNITSSEEHFNSKARRTKD